MVERRDSTGKYNIQDFEGLQEVLAIATNRNILTSSLASELASLLPPCVSLVLQQWNSLTPEDCIWVISFVLKQSVHLWILPLRDDINSFHTYAQSRAIGTSF